MRARPLYCALLLLTLSGCLISEQTGQGHEDLVFHFDTQFNRMVLFGRTAALGVVGVWLLRASRKKIGPVAVGAAILGGALFLFVSDFPKIGSYRVEVLGDGLHVTIPPDAPTAFAWDAIEEMYLEGIGPVGPRRQDAVSKLLELPEWHSMEVTTAGGAKYEMDLRALSMEQRQILWKAIARRARLVQVE